MGRDEFIYRRAFCFCAFTSSSRPNARGCRFKLPTSSVYRTRAGKAGGEHSSERRHCGAASTHGRGRLAPRLPNISSARSRDSLLRLSVPSSALVGPVGRGGGPVERFAGPVGRVTGPVGRVAGPVERFAGPVGRVAGGRVAGPVGRVAGPFGRVAEPFGRFARPGPILAPRGVPSSSSRLLSSGASPLEVSRAGPILAPRARRSLNISIVLGREVQAPRPHSAVTSAARNTSSKTQLLCPSRMRCAAASPYSNWRTSSARNLTNSFTTSGNVGAARSCSSPRPCNSRARAVTFCAIWTLLRRLPLSLPLASFRSSS